MRLSRIPFGHGGQLHAALQLGLAFALISAFCSTAVAQSPGYGPRDSGYQRSGSPAGNDWQLSLEAATRMPIDVGGQVRLQSPFWLRVTAGAGVVPRGYVGMLNGALAANNVYDPIAESLINSAFESGWTYNFRVGIRPSRTLGLYADVGIGRAQLSGGLDVATVAATTDTTLPVNDFDAYGYGVETNFDLLIAEVGWEGHIGDHFLLGIGVGLLAVTNAQSTATANFEEAQTEVITEATDEATALLDDTIESYGYLPTLTVRLGFDL